MRTQKVARGAAVAKASPDDQVGQAVDDEVVEGDGTLYLDQFIVAYPNTSAL